jgi:dUTP pyrophosphatase
MQAKLETKPKVEIKLDDPRCIPLRGHPNDAGADLVSIKSLIIYPNCIDMVDTGVSIKIPVGFVGLVYSRSSQGKLRVSLSNSVGVIDSDYRGNIKLILVNEGDDPYEIKAYTTKIAQLVITPIMLPEFVLHDGDTWLDTKRGTGGFGSTGA